MNPFKIAGTIILVFGGLLLGVGLMFSYFKWDYDLFQGIYTGPIFIVIGLILLLIGLRRSQNKK